MYDVKSLLSVIDKEFPFGLQENYDNSGLIIGKPSDKIEGILITLDVTEEVIDEAIEKKCNVILAHHPIIFKSIKSITGKTYVERVIIKAIKNNISIIASHTNTDNLLKGTNKIFANKLGLINQKVLVPKPSMLKKIVTFVPLEYEEKVKQALFNAGAGVIGNYDNTSFSCEGIGSFKGNEETNPFVGESGKIHYEKEKRIETIFPDYLTNKIINALLHAHPYEEPAYDIYSLDNVNTYAGSGIVGNLENEENFFDFLKKIKKITTAKCIKYTNPINPKVKRIAICGGTCMFALKNAISEKADVFITSDIKYHEFFDAENNISIIEVGHFELEHFVKEVFLKIVKKNFPNFAVYLSEINTNPINYF